MTSPELVPQPQGSRRLRVADRKMASRAVNALGAPVHVVGIDRLCDRLVTTTAGRLHYPAVKIRNSNVVGITPGSEIERMKETVRCLDGVLPDEIVRRMAVIARSNRTMAG